MKALITTIAVLLLPVTLALNVASGASALWLMWLGEWGTIGWGVFLGVVGAFSLALAFMPGVFLFAMPAAFLLERNYKVLAAIVGVPAMLWWMGVLTGWNWLILDFMMGRAGPGTFIPTLLWAYGTALAPPTWMLAKEQQMGGDTESSTVACMFAQMSFIALALWLFVV